MKRLNLHEVKTQFSKYIDIVESGETLIVCKRNVPVAEIRPIAKKHKKPPELGWAKGTYKFSADFSDAYLSQWEGDEQDPLRKYSPKRARRKK
jgi:prevent-host-death family protein